MAGPMDDNLGSTIGPSVSPLSSRVRIVDLSYRADFIEFDRTCLGCIPLTSELDSVTHVAQIIQTPTKRLFHQDPKRLSEPGKV